MSWLRSVLIRAGVIQPRATETVTPLAPERVAEIEDGIEASLAKRHREMEAASERSLRGWSTRRAQVDRSADPILPYRKQLLARKGRA